MESIQKRKEVIQSRIRELDNIIASERNRQMSIKILLNSLFGAIGLLATNGIVILICVLQRGLL